MEDYKRQLIAKWLTDFKRAAETSFTLVERRENMATLANLGLTIRNCRDEILSLSVNDYVSGPQADKTGEGNVWIFGKEIEGKKIYIKLKLMEIGEEKIAKCISFHVAEHPLEFPYK